MAAVADYDRAIQFARRQKAFLFERNAVAGKARVQALISARSQEPTVFGLAEAPPKARCRLLAGTFETCQHVLSLVAIRGKADIGKAALNKGVSQLLAVATFLSAG